MEVKRTYDKLKDGTYRTDGFYEFDLYERGKKRHIRSVTMRERVVQKCLCENSLVPAVTRSFIYDNGASLEMKGYHFSMERMKRHLQWHYRKHGSEGYILLFDFSHFFDNVSHKIVYDELKKRYSDRKLLGLTMHFVRAFGDVGMGLGSQISQTLALLSANRLDHVIKEELRIKCYGRYMDDGYLIHDSKDYLMKCLDRIREVCRESGIILNEKKTQIVKISHGFTFLKARFYLTETGKVVRKIYKKSIVRERRKLKKFVPLLESGVMSYTDVTTAFQSWCAYAKNFSAWHTIQNMCRLYNELFIYPWIKQGGIQGC